MIADEHGAINRRLKEITGRFIVPAKAAILLSSEASPPYRFPPEIEACFLLDVEDRTVSLLDVRGISHRTSGSAAEFHMLKMLESLQNVFPSATRVRLFEIRMSVPDCERLVNQVRISPK